MDCPYCAEEVKDRAVICRHCRQYLLPWTAVAERLDDIESRLEAQRSAVPGATTSMDAAAIDYPDVIALATMASSALLYAFVSALSSEDALSRSVIDALLIPLAFFAPAAGFGFFLGSKLPGVRRWRYLPPAILVGVLDATVFLVVTSAFARNAVSINPMNTALWVPGGTFAFLGGCYAGDWFQVRNTFAALDRTQRWLIKLAPFLSAAAALLSAAKTGAAR
jgi:hypothetical protein